MTSATSEIRSITLSSLRLSETSSQLERRKHIDKASLTELATSIKQVGILQPIVVRSIDGNGTFQIVAGERRYLAAKEAGLKDLLASVRELTDEQVLELQLVENLQRQDLHELAEAEGYEALQKLGHTVDEMAAKVGKSTGTIYARMKLLALCKEARSAFYAGKLSASTALLLARIPIEALQKDALKVFLTGRWGHGEPLSYREAQRYVHETFMLRLDQAGFPTGDKDLVPAAGACSACPKRTGNQPELFGDIKSADVCTDPVCFKSKREANAVRLLEKARAAGQEVISGAQAKKIAPAGVDRHITGGYVRLNDPCLDDPKNRSNAQLLGKDFEPLLLQDPESGKIVPIAKESHIAAALKLKGIDRGRSSYQVQQSAREKKANRERHFRRSLYQAIRAKLPKALGASELRQVAIEFFKRHQFETQKGLLKLWEIEAEKSKHHGGVDTEVVGAAHLAKASDASLALYLQDMVYALDMQVSSWSSGGPEQLLAAAKRLRINADKIRTDLAAAEKAKTRARKPKRGTKASRAK